MKNFNKKENNPCVFKKELFFLAHPLLFPHLLGSLGEEALYLSSEASLFTLIFRSNRISITFSLHCLVD